MPGCEKENRETNPNHVQMAPLWLVFNRKGSNMIPQAWGSLQDPSGALKLNGKSQNPRFHSFSGMFTYFQLFCPIHPSGNSICCRVAEGRTYGRIKSCGGSGLCLYTPWAPLAPMWPSGDRWGPKAATQGHPWGTKGSSKGSPRIPWAWVARGFAPSHPTILGRLRNPTPETRGL